MSCKCAKYEEDENRYYCDVSGDMCMFMSPNSKACAEEYGEGPDVSTNEEIEVPFNEKQEFDCLGCCNNCETEQCSYNETRCQ